MSDFDKTYEELMAKYNTNNSSVPVYDFDVNEDSTPIAICFSLFNTLVSRLRGNAILSGHIILELLFPNDSRAFKDSDVSVMSADLNDEMRKVLHEFGEYCVSNKLHGVVKYDIKPDVVLGCCGGISCRDSAGSYVFSVDVEIEKDLFTRKTVYTLHHTAFQGNSVEAILCDKVLTSLSRRRFRRAEDFFDINLIISNGVRYNTKTVMDLILLKSPAEDITTLLLNYPFSESIVTQLSTVWDKLPISYISKVDGLNKPSFEKVYNSAGLIYSSLVRECALRRFIDERSYRMDIQ